MYVYIYAYIFIYIYILLCYILYIIYIYILYKRISRKVVRNVCKKKKCYIHFLPPF